MVDDISDVARQSALMQQTDDSNPLKDALHYYGLYVRPYLWVYILSPILFLVAAIIFVQTVTPRYESTCQLHISSKQANITEIRGVMDGSIGGASEEAFINTQMLLLQSKDVMDKAYELFSRGLSAEAYEECSAPKVNRERGTMLVNLTIESTNPESAARLANTLVEVYLEASRARRQNISRTGAELLRNQLEEIRKSREMAMNELVTYKEAHGIFNLSENYAALVKQINALTETIVEATVLETELATTLEAIEDNRVNAVRLMPFIAPEGGNSSTLGALKMLHLTHETELPELLRQYNETHPAVQAHMKVREMIVAAEEAEVDVSVAGLRLQYERAQKRSKMLQEQIADLRKQVADLDRVSGEYQIREDACESLENTYRMLVNRINELNITNATESVDNASIFVVSPAVSAADPFFPNKLKICAIAIILGGAVAGGFGFVFGSLNNTAKDIQAVNQLFGNNLAVYGNVPLFEEGEAALLKSSGHDDIDEAFRNIRISLNLSLATHGGRIMAISSTFPGEGKTFVSFNLAKSFAMDNRRVLLLEMDLHRPRLWKLLSPIVTKKPEKGVSNVLIGDCDLKSVTMHVKDFNLDIAFAGPVPPNAAEMLGTKKLADLLAEAQANYDCVLIDTPPILAVSDTLIIASQHIPLLLVTRLFTTSMPALRHLRDRLASVNLRLAGLLANNADVPKNSYGYYGSDSYGYKYGYGYGYKHRGVGYGQDPDSDATAEKKKS